MKKRHSLIKVSGGACLALFSLIAVSCAQDGFTDETFGSSVHNTTLVSPELTQKSFSTVTMSDGSEKVKVTWDVVDGAGGYDVTVHNVDDPENPVVVFDDIVDGCTALFPKTDDTKYSVSVRTIGNVKLNNKDAEEATLFAYSTMIDATIIPNGSDIAEFINANVTSSENELAFELEAGGEYTLNDVANFKNNKYTLRGNKIDHPIVKVGDKGSIWTGAGLKVKWIDFDCTDMAVTTTSNVGLLCLDKASYDEPGIYENCKSDVLGYKDAGANQNTLVLEDPVIMSDCVVKNLPMALFWANNGTSWAMKDLRVTDCLVQLNNGKSSKALISFEDEKSTGGYLMMTLRNNTFLNIADNSSAFTIRLKSGSNAVPKKLFGNAYEKSGRTTIESNTWIKCMSGKAFGNQMVSNGVMTFSMNGNIFYDTYQVYKAIGNCTKEINQEKNTIYGITKPVDSSDKNYSTEEDPDFEGPFLQELDLTKPNGGINLKPRGVISSTIGDPRWRE